MTVAVLVAALEGDPKSRPVTVSCNGTGMKWLNEMQHKDHQ